MEEEYREIAALMVKKGRESSLRALRPVDRAIYFHRLLLQLAINRRANDHDGLEIWQCGDWHFFYTFKLSSRRRSK